MKRTDSRAGFTLMELLVVIAIIGILLGIMIPAVLAYLDKVPETTALNEINQIATSLAGFKQEFKCYPPSKVRLLESCKTSNSAGAPVAGTYDLYVDPTTGPRNRLDASSVATLSSMWRISFSPSGVSPGIDWNGDGDYTDDFVLDGDQCLVYFLGGIPTPPSSPPGCLGFSTSKSDPSRPPSATTPERIGPFYTFVSSRLAVVPSTSGPPRAPFYSYIDPRTKVPYAYFTYRKRPNEYFDDCDAIGAKPYYLPLASPTSPRKYHNPETFQIIYAGRDLQFGGYQWDPANPASGTNAHNPGNKTPHPGYDDRTNFCGNILGVGN